MLVVSSYLHCFESWSIRCWRPSLVWLKQKQHFLRKATSRDFCHGMQPCEVEKFTIMNVDTVTATWKAQLGKNQEMPNRVGASTHTCLIPLLMRKELDTFLLKLKVPVKLMWKDMMMHIRLGGQPTFRRRPLPLTRSYAFVRFGNPKYKGCLCSRHFSRSCLTENTISVVDLLDLKTNCVLG